jgi:oleate hydratase
MGDQIQNVLEQAQCIPCMMPYITSQFLTRVSGDRPAVTPKGWRNLAIIGQFCEIPDDVVFTVEYSVRSAKIAVNSLLNLNEKIPPIYKGLHHPDVLFKAFGTLLKE